MAAEEQHIPDICNSLKKYYASQNKPYEGNFSEWCEDNGMDTDTIKEEFEMEVDEMTITEFEEGAVDFPFYKDVGEEDKQKEMIDVIRNLYQNPAWEPAIGLPEFTKELFEGIDQNSIEQIKKMYQAQCPAIYNQGMSGDINLLTILAIGKKQQFDYLQLLVNAYDRYRIQNPDEILSPQQWAGLQDNKHFKSSQLKDVKVKIPTKDGKVKLTPYLQFATSCMSSFSGRMCGKLLMTNAIKIDDSVEKAVKIISIAIEFISNEVKKESTCPFQFDICIAGGKPKTSENTSLGGDDGDDDDDDDEDDDDPNEEKDDGSFEDIIGDIEAKLKGNDLPYIKKPLPDKARDFGLLFNDLKAESKEKDKDNYLQNKRFIGFIDRRTADKRKKDNKSDIYLYEPPSGEHPEYARNIPRDAVPEWGISASRTCLIPPSKYNEGVAIGTPNMKQVDKTSKTNDPKDKNIGAHSHAAGSLLILSFHVRSQDLIKAYMYYSGQIVRFFADDLKILLENIFDIEGKNKANAEYLKSEKFKDILELMKEKIVDKQFKSWNQKYGF